MDIEHGRIIETPITVNDTEYKGFSIPGITRIDEAWFQLGRMSICIEDGTAKYKSDGDWVMLESSGEDSEVEDLGDWLEVESLSTVMGDY